MNDKKSKIPKAKVIKSPHGWQVYAAGPKGHIAQGQPHRDLGAAKRDAKKFEETEIDEADVKKTKKKELFKSRKYRFTTPGQDRDFETLDANRMFKSYEEIEKEDESMTTTAAVADPKNIPLFSGKRKREVDVFFKNRIDGRTKDYKETVTRLQARRDATAARDLEQKLNMFGVQSNPFREDTQMENKKYLKTKEGSIEDAVLQSVRTETPINPNDARPTLHLPEKKYLDSKDGSLERAVTDVMVTETISGNMIRDLRMLDRHQFQARYRMTKSQAQQAGSGIQRYGRTGGRGPASDERQEAHDQTRIAHEASAPAVGDVDAYNYKAKKGAIAAPGSGSIAKPKKAKSSDVNKSIEQQMADARKEEMDPRQEREMLKRNVNNPAQSPKAKELMRKRISKLSHPKKEEVEMDESWKKVKPTDRVQRLDQLSISGWLSKQMGRKGDPHKFNHKVPSIYFDDVDLVVDSDTVVPRALSGNTTMADLLKKVQAHAKKKRLRWEAVEMTEGSKQIKTAIKMAKQGGGAMTPTTAAIEKKWRGMSKQKHVKAALQKYNEEDGYDEQSAAGRGERGVGSQAYTDYIRNLTPGETAVKDKESKESSSASKQVAAEKKRQITRIDDAVDPAKERENERFKQERKDAKMKHIDAKADIEKDKLNNSLDIAKIMASEVNEEIIVGLLDMGIIQIDENKETGFTVINAPIANRENLLRMAYNTGAEILDEYTTAPDAARSIEHKKDRPDEKAVKKGKKGEWIAKGARKRMSKHYDQPDTGPVSIRRKERDGKTVGHDAVITMKGLSKRKRASAQSNPRKADVTGRGLAYAASEYVPQGTEIDEKKVSSDAYDHATALYKDQWKDRKIADYDKEHDKDSRAKEMRKDAEVDRKRMWAMTGDKWKHAKGASGEEKGKKSVTGNTPDPKDAYKKEELSPLVSASVRAIGKLVEKDWIKGAIKKPGALHTDLGVPQDEKIPKSKIKAAAKEGGKVGQRARLAITLGKMKK